MPYLLLLTVISIGFFLVPSVSYAYLPAPTLSQVIMSWFGVVVTLGTFAFMLVVLSGFLYTLWRYWKKKPVKGTIRLFI